MKRVKLLLSILLCLVPLSAFPAGKGRVEPSFSLEWGYRASFLHIYHNNYYSDKGIRIDERGCGFQYFSNGTVILCAGIDFLEHFNTSLCFGFEGIYDGRNVIPLTARFTYFFDGYDSQGFKLFADGGIAFAECFNKKILNQCKVGGGYRFPLSSIVSLDLSAHIEYAYDSPVKVYTRYDKSLIPVGNLRRSEFSHFLAGLTLSINF